MAQYNSNNDRTHQTHANTAQQNSQSGRAATNGNSGRRSIKTIQRNNQQVQQPAANFHDSNSPVALYENPNVNGITGVNIYPQAKSQLNLQMSGHHVGSNPHGTSNSQLNNIVAKFETIQKNGKSQRSLPHTQAMISHTSPQKYTSLTNQNAMNQGNIKSQTQHLNKTITYPANSSLISRNN